MKHWFSNLFTVQHVVRDIYSDNLLFIKHLFMFSLVYYVMYFFLFKINSESETYVSITDTST